MVANHAHADGTGAWPAVATLAAETRISERQVQRILRVLERSGEITAIGVHEATQTMEYRVNGVDGVQIQLLPEAARGDTGTRGDKMSPLTPGTGRGDKTSPRGDIAVAPKRPSEPPVEITGTAKSENAARPPTERELAAALKASVAWAEEQWLARRRATAIDRWLEPWGRPLKERVGRAYQDGCTDADLAAAIAELAVDPKGSPWYIDERARQAVTRRENAQHDRERGQEAVQRARDLDAQAEADWQRRERETGKTRAELIREMAPKPGNGPLSAAVQATVTRVTEHTSTPATPAEEAAR